MYYTIYKITNQVNGKIYIGSHKTSNLDDNYMGSGKYLKYAQEKYGVENFTKEVLFVFDTPEEMYAKEAEIVNEEFLAEENTYNLKIGGFGGWDYVNADEDMRIAKNKRAREITNSRHADLLQDWSSRGGKMRYKLHGVEQAWAEARASFAGKRHTEEAKSKMSSAAKKRTKEQNSQYGTRWIHSLEFKVSKRIKKEDPLPEGWLEGRKMKFDACVVER